MQRQEDEEKGLLDGRRRRRGKTNREGYKEERELVEEKQKGLFYYGVRKIWWCVNIHVHSTKVMCGFQTINMTAGFLIETLGEKGAMLVLR